MQRVIGVGAGGHSQGIVEILRVTGTYDVVGLLDVNPVLHGKSLAGLPVLGSDELLPKLRAEGVTHAFLGVGTVGDTKIRQELHRTLLRAGFLIVSAIHPHALISSSAVIGTASTIMAKSVINWNARLGDNVIVNTAAVIEHDCLIGDHVHVATGALLAGGVSVGLGSHIGIGAVVRQNIIIGQNVVVGAGAVVVRDVPDQVVVAGVPATILRQNHT